MNTIHPVDAAEVAKAVRKYAYRHYDKTGRRYTLTSGQLSDEYLDVKSMILNNSGGHYLAGMVSSAIGYVGFDVVAGVETGGALLARLVGTCRNVHTLCIRKDDRSHGCTVHGIDGIENLPPPRGAGDERLRTWLVEDVITTGGSVVSAVEKICKFGRLQLAGIVAVVDREQDGIERIVRALNPDLKVPVIALTTLSAVRAG